MRPDGEVFGGTRPSFDDFFAAHSGHLVRLAYLLLGDQADAEDVAQDVLEQLYRRWDTLRDGSVPAYSRTAVVNRCRSLQRRRAVARRFAPRLARAEAAESSAVEDQGLWDLVQALPGRQREVLVLRYWCDLPDVQIAQVLGISSGTVKSSAHHARARLAAALGDEALRQRRSPEGVL
jgi:RNA polymerase sigma-70 factor (sigma-E family)